MSRRFRFTVNTTRAIPVRRQYQVSSNKVANEAQINEWCNRIYDFIHDYDEKAELGYSLTKAYLAYEDACVQLCTGAILAGAAPIANPGPPIMPVGHPVLSGQKRRELWEPHSQLWDAAVIAGVAAVAYINPNPNPPVPQLTEDEFNDLLWYILYPMANSGFTGVGDYNQDIAYTLEGEPEDMFLTFKLKTLLGRCLPDGVTPRQIGAAYADLIAATAKEQDVVFDWGDAHGCPRSMNHLGFSTCLHIKDKTLMNDEQRAVMAEVVAISLRDKDSFKVSDPKAPRDDLDEDKKAMANLTMANRRTHQTHGYKQSRHFNPNFRFGGDDE